MAGFVSCIRPFYQAFVCDWRNEAAGFVAANWAANWLRVGTVAQRSVRQSADALRSEVISQLESARHRGSSQCGIKVNHNANRENRLH